ncbi:hypothetical protein DPEC_G00067950 [Dallia pectoralis]|uniref:Uncharacterized protein n=1 Tax=Dallia pectoralis TaxID=75939 RepID=A0ACC2H1N5_DALPE|nr:hypothetical protein DPEC_G00067950 [Dallia pectoralis]
MAETKVVQTGPQCERRGGHAIRGKTEKVHRRPRRDLAEAARWTLEGFLVFRYSLDKLITRRPRTCLSHRSSTGTCPLRRPTLTGAMRHNDPAQDPGSGIFAEQRPVLLQATADRGPWWRV